MITFIKLTKPADAHQAKLIIIQAIKMNASLQAPPHCASYSLAERDPFLKFLELTTMQGQSRESLS